MATNKDNPGKKKQSKLDNFKLFYEVVPVEESYAHPALAQDEELAKTRKSDRIVRRRRFLKK